MPATATMESLLKNHSAHRPPQLGEVVKGSVVDTGSNALYLDLGPVGTGIIYGIELKDGLGTYDKLKVGDTIEATVVEIENENGYVELSLREASLEKAWGMLEQAMEQNQTVSTKILDANKGGLLIEHHGITGFLPVSQLSTEHYPRVAEGDKSRILYQLRSYIGQYFDVQVISLDQSREKLIVSEKAAQSESFQTVMKNLKVGDVVEGIVSGLADFGVFIKFQPDPKLDQVEGLVHISELAWQRIDNPSEVVEVEDTVKAKIISLDNNRISLSLKEMTEDPWGQVEKKYKVGQVVNATVKRIGRFGAFIELMPEISGLAHISQFKDGKIEKALKAGQSYDFKITTIDAKDHRMGLELVQSKPKKPKKPDKI